MCMAREEWYSLYTDAVESVWREERAELKNTAMLIHILGLELSRVKDLAESELSSCRQKFLLVDKIKTEKKTPENKQIMSVSKPSITPIMIPKTENPVQSYVSPDLFHHDSFDYAENLLVNKEDSDIVLTQQNSTHNLDKPINPKQIRKEEIDDSIIISTQPVLSPTLNRPNNLFNIKKYKLSLSTNKKIANDGFKFPIFNKQQTPPTKLVDEVIQATPEPKKLKRIQKSQRKYKQTHLTDKTLTQMYPSLNITKKIVDGLEDTEATIRLSQNPKKDDEDDIVVIVNEKENTPEKLNGFKNFIDDYDEVPTKSSTPMDKKKPNCNKCLKYGIKCAQHKILSESYNRTYSGFWDVDFTVDDPNDDSDSSIRF